MEIDVIHRIIEDFLRQKEENELKETQKKLKEKFGKEHKQKIYDKYKKKTWINHVAQNATKVSLNISHVAKLTHSSSKASDLTDVIPQTKYSYLITTQTANVNEFDSRYSSAEYAPIAEFLSYPVKNSSESLGQYLAKDERYFTNISNDQNVRQDWQQKIALAYSPKKLSSHVLAKQVYIPVNNNEYHLLSPVKSSSLAHKIFDAVSQSRDKKNDINKAHKEKIWHSQDYIYYPNAAFLGVTKSNHQNASKLNGIRRGGLYLFQASPPLWSYNSKPPKSIEQFLAGCFNDCKEIFKDIKRFVYVIKRQQLTLNLDRKLILSELLNAMCDMLFNQISIIKQAFSTGWSNDFEVPLFLKAFLDTDSMNQKLSRTEHQLYVDEFVQQVAKWISYHIGDKKRESSWENLWIKIIRPSFRSFYAVIIAE